MTTPTPDREFISQFSTSTVGLLIHIGGALADVDGNVMNVIMQPDGGGTPVFSRAAEHVAPGTYQTTFSTSDTATPGTYTLTWSYMVNGAQEMMQSYIQIGSATPAYDALDDDMKAIVELTWMRFADGFDSPNGGPVLQTFFQTNYTRGRLAQLLQLALGRLNTWSQPYQSFEINDVNNRKFPTGKWGSLLEQALYIETLKHLIRSYVEQPIIEGAGYTRAERRDYMQRWMEILQMEEGEFVKRQSVYKISFMGLGRARVTVSGGAYAMIAYDRLPFNAARPTFYSRFY